ncbi:hypothetical protein HDV05_005357 [Chytridiales sp. JEL 0842]|nr:hypothetical protein HDV05_005357 [Chytridiales sp. JEL 0842]
MFTKDNSIYCVRAVKAHSDNNKPIPHPPTSPVDPKTVGPRFRSSFAIEHQLEMCAASIASIKSTESITFVDPAVTGPRLSEKNAHHFNWF